MTAAASDSSQVLILDAIRAIRVSIRQVLVITILVFLPLTLIILTDQPIYRASVTLAPSPPMSDPGPSNLATAFLAGGVAGQSMVFERTSANQAYSVLRSRAISRQFIQEEQLLPILFADQWDAENHSWLDPEASGQPSLNDGLRLFQRKIRFVTKDPETGFISVNIEWTDPSIVAHWANRLVTITDDAIRERDIEEARENIRFLQQKAHDEPLASVRQLIFDLVEKNAKTIVVASVNENYVFTIIDPAVTPQENDQINIPASFKLSLALIFAFGCGALWAIIAFRGAAC